MKTTNSILLDANDVAEELSRHVAQAGSQAHFCVAHKVSTSYLSDVLNGKQEPGKKILDILGLVRVSRYSRK